MVIALDEQLTTKQVADVLRVSESSVKRWCDSGVIPTVRTVGGHRRIARSALMQFLKSAAGRDDRALISGDQLARMGVELESLQEEQDSPPPPKLTGSLDQQRLREAFEEALLRGDEPGSRRALTQWYQAERAFAPLADELIAKTFHRLGDLWECNQIEIYQERRSAELCVRLVHELRRSSTRGTAGDGGDARI
jgi:excisionase family DNA binding protein